MLKIIASIVISVVLLFAIYLIAEPYIIEWQMHNLFEAQRGALQNLLGALGGK